MKPTTSPVRLGRRSFLHLGTFSAAAFALAVAGCGTASAPPTATRPAASAAGIPASAATPTAGTPAHWTYEGAEGPEHWGDLDPTYAACSKGQAQSPIDIANPTDGDLPDITFAEQTLSPIKIINNGHTVQVNAQPGNTFAFSGVTYELTQFHFHSTSEHEISGKAQSMELHLVHKDKDGNLAVLAVLLKEGAENAALKPVFANLPSTAGPEQTVNGTVKLGELLPSDKRTFRYDGSLTTPPCSEGVKWIVFVQPMEVSKAQIDAFRALYPENARPLQSPNNRKVAVGE